MENPKEHAPIGFLRQTNAQILGMFVYPAIHESFKIWFSLRIYILAKMMRNKNQFRVMLMMLTGQNIGFSCGSSFGFLVWFSNCFFPVLVLVHLRIISKHFTSFHFSIRFLNSFGFSNDHIEFHQSPITFLSIQDFTMKLK